MGSFDRPTPIQRAWAVVVFGIVAFVPIVLIAGALLAMEVPDAVAGVGALFAWGGVLGWLSYEEQKGSRIGRAVARVSKLTGLDHYN